MLFGLLSNPQQFVLIIVAWLVALTVHEFMHAWMANYLGDPTAKYAGRLSLNPISHLDVIGTMMILFVGIGWAKPVPVNESNFRNPRLGSALTSIAGPGSNLVLAIILSLFLRFDLITNAALFTFLLTIVEINIFLMIFNLIPIPPLDGSKVLYYFLPRNIDIVKLETYGPFLLLILLFLTGGTFFNLLSYVASFFLNLLGVNITLF